MGANLRRAVGGIERFAMQKYRAMGGRRQLVGRWWPVEFIDDAVGENSSGGMVTMRAARAQKRALVRPLTVV
jgi:hypothetical protein